MNLQRIFITLISLMLVFALAACGRAPEAPASKKPVIGLSLHNLQDGRWQKDRDLFEQRAMAKGAEVITLAADGDESKQGAQIDALLAQHIDVLVVVAQNTETLAPAIAKAKAQGVKVLSYARLIKNADVDFFVSIDNEKAGELQANEIIKRAPQGNYLYIGGGDTDGNAVSMRTGSIRALKAQEASVKVVGDQYSKDWSPEEAYLHTKEALVRTKGNIQGIVAANDGTAGGAIRALREYGVKRVVPVSGMDAELDALQRVATGEQAVSLYIPIEKMSTAAAETALALAAGQTPASKQTSPNGKKDVPSLLLEPIAVTKDNLVSTVIKDEFASLEDVYKNVPKNQWPTP